MITDEDIISNYYKEDGKARCSRKKLTEEQKEYMLNRFPDTQDLKEIAFRLKNGMTKNPNCPVCGKELYWTGFYRSYCSRQCERKAYFKRLEETTGCKSTFQFESTKQKIKQTCLEKYGVENYSSTKECREKVKATVQERYGCDNVFQNVEVKEQIKQTLVNKYGVEHPAANREINQRMRDTMTKNYGAWFTQSEKYKENQSDYMERRAITNIERYGVKCVLQSDEVKQKIKQSMLDKYGVDNWMKSTNNSQYVVEKSKQTCLEKYGNESYLGSEQRKIDSKTRYGAEFWQQSSNYEERKSEILAKQFDSKLRNNSFNKSEIEETVATWLESEGIKFRRQYHSVHYPWPCDFWLEDYDLYVEVNGFWTHGFHPYDANSEEDKKTLEKWKAKESSNFYKNAIRKWTLTDPLKRKTASMNGLNFLEIFSCDFDTCRDKILEKIKQTNR